MDRSEQKTIKKFGKSSSGRSHVLHNFFQGTHIYGTSRSHLCDQLSCSCNKKRQLPVWLVIGLQLVQPTVSVLYKVLKLKSTNHKHIENVSGDSGFVFWLPGAEW